MMRTIRTGTALTVLVGAGVLLSGIAPVTACWRELARWASDPTTVLTTGDYDRAALALVGTLAWIMYGWIWVAIGLTAGSVLPGTFGRLADAVLSMLMPLTVRRLIAVATGLALASGVPVAASATPPAHADPTGGGRATAVAVTAELPDLDWPLGRDGRHVPSDGSAPGSGRPPPPAAPPAAPRPDRPAGPNSGPSSGPSSGFNSGPGGRAVVVVRSGDTLWDLAAAHLGGTPTTRAVAAEWPRWWAANRDTIGADPDLLLPGQRLTPPPTTAADHRSAR
jgi:hypothetical protein